ncbi:fimbrial protein [Sodalis sp. C49]|uniref:fimbrial protein n=1 Tax=unclassified Sodalis (in: enterobacteria) TaxID=2636512 RepID=UPI003965A7CA
MKSTFTLPALAVAGILSCGLANAADGTINFTGTILDTACVVEPAVVAVNMGSLTVAAFSGVGATAGSTPFSITLTSCPAGLTTAQVFFSGAADPADSTVLGLTAGGATGAGIALFESDGSTRVNLGAASVAQPVTAAGGSLDFVAKYMQTATPIVAGAANATAEFVLQYP